MLGNILNPVLNFDRLKAQRIGRARREASPDYLWTVPVIAATVRTSIEIKSQFPDAGKYMPMDWVEIVNNDVVNVTLRINGLYNIYCPKGTIRQKDDTALWQLDVTNNDAAVASTLGSIVVRVRRQAVTADKKASES